MLVGKAGAANRSPGRFLVEWRGEAGFPLKPTPAIS